MTEKEKLGNELRKLRENTPSSEYDNVHISQQELADKNIGLTKYFIGTIERGEANPTLEKLIFHLKALNLKKVTILNVEIDIDKFIEENSTRRQ